MRLPWRGREAARDAFGRLVEEEAPAAASARPAHAPDADPSEVPPVRRIGFDGRPLGGGRPSNGQYPGHFGGGF